MAEIMLIIVLVFFLLMSLKKYKTIFNPLVIFNFIWVLTLFLYEFKLSEIQRDLSSRTIVVFWICVLSYNVSFWIHTVTKRKKVIGIVVKRHLGVDTKIKICKYIVILLFFTEILYSGGLPIIWLITGSNKIYFDYGIPSLHGAWCGLVICLGAYSLLKKTNDKWIYIIMGILIISRQLVMSIVIEGLIYAVFDRNFLSYNPESRKVPKWVFIVIGFVSIALFTIVGNFRSGNDVMNIVFQAKDAYKNLPVSFKWIYSYMTFSLSNFDNLVNMSKGAVNNGASMLSDMLPTVLLNIFNINIKENPYYLISPNYTVSTYLPSIYLDFGLVGILVFNSLMAFWGANIYRNVVRNKNDVNMLLMSLYIHNIVFLFFQNFFLYLPVLVQFIYIPIIFSEKEINR